jgi:hypothetical protein
MSKTISQLKQRAGVAPSVKRAAQSKEALNIGALLKGIGGAAKGVGKLPSKISLGAIGRGMVSPGGQTLAKGITGAGLAAAPVVGASLLSRGINQNSASSLASTYAEGGKALPNTTTRLDKSLNPVNAAGKPTPAVPRPTPVAADEFVGPPGVYAPSPSSPGGTLPFGEPLPQAEPSTWDGIKNHLGNNWGYYAAGGAGLYGLSQMMKKREPEENERRASQVKRSDGRESLSEASLDAIIGGALPAAAAAGMVAGPSAGITGAMLGAAKAPRGYGAQGAARGGIAGVGTGIGALAGGVGGLLASEGSGLAGLAGAGLGGLGGHVLTNGLMGKAPWEQEQAQAPASDVETKEAALAVAYPFEAGFMKACSDHKFTADQVENALDKMAELHPDRVKGFLDFFRLAPTR